jgi:ABC-2 type transport system permease protein
MIALAFAAASLRRLLRDRLGLFFIVLLPIVMILVIGATVRGQSEFRVGVTTGAAVENGPLADQLTHSLRESTSIDARAYDDETAMRDGIRRGELDAGVIIPPDLDVTLVSGGRVRIPVLVNESVLTGQAVWAAVEAVVAEHAAVVQAAAFAAEQAGGTVGSHLPLAEQVRTGLPQVTVETEAVNADSEFLPLGFSYSGPTMLVLFVFINALAGGAAMIQTRRLGIYDRALAAPIHARDVVLGEALLYLALALLQSVLIVVLGAALFDVDWGDPLAAAALITVWALVGTGAGMLSGTLFRTSEQASAIGPAVGIALGMLGGCMWPLEIVPAAVRTVGYLTPHSWAIDGWTEVLSNRGGLIDIGGPLAILSGFAVALLVLASLRLRRTLAT